MVVSSDDVPIGKFNKNKQAVFLINVFVEAGCIEWIHLIDQSRSEYFAIIFILDQLFQKHL